jgi:hypothetical protein
MLIHFNNINVNIVAMWTFDVGKLAALNVGSQILYHNRIQKYATFLTSFLYVIQNNTEMAQNLYLLSYLMAINVETLYNIKFGMVTDYNQIYKVCIKCLFLWWKLQM